MEISLHIGGVKVSDNRSTPNSVYWMEARWYYYGSNGILVTHGQIVQGLNPDKVNNILHSQGYAYGLTPTHFGYQDR